MNSNDCSKVFDLICLSCGNIYEGYFNNEICNNCREEKTIRWILKPELREVVKKPHDCTVENFNKNISITVTI